MKPGFHWRGPAAVSDKYIGNPFLSGLENPSYRIQRESGLENPFDRIQRESGLENPSYRYRENRGWKIPPAEYRGNLGWKTPPTDTEGIGVGKPLLQIQRESGLENPSPGTAHSLVGRGNLLSYIHIQLLEISVYSVGDISQFLGVPLGFAPDEGFSVNVC